MHRLATVPTLAGARGGFIHVPQLPDMGAPSLPLALMVQGVRTALQVALTTPADLRLTGGAVH
jgi:pyroglutamyl-peptidase